MGRKFELLAPGGDVDSIKAAIVAGADAVFCGLNKFNARNRAANISFDNLLGIIRLAHKNDCQVFLTLNILILESEITELISLLNKLVNTKIDGIIVQDFGMFYLLNSYFKSIPIHASTQLTTHNKGQVQFLQKLNATRVNLSRELNSKEITELSAVAHKNKMLTEVFVHGSYCLSFSGICYMSSVHGGRSGNRGRCSQPCRERYLTTPAGKEFPLNLKDNSAFTDVKELHQAGVDSLKIEGRIKEFEYVYTVVNAWRNQLDNFEENNLLIDDKSALYKVFNRDFTNGFLKGEISKDMFIDNPMSNSTRHLLETNSSASIASSANTKQALYDEKEESRDFIWNKIKHLNIEKIPLEISVSGESGEPLKVSVRSADDSFCVLSTINLASKGTEVLTAKMLLKRLKTIDETEYYIEDLNLAELDDGVYLPFKELTALKKRLLFVLNDSKAWISPITVPKIKQQKNAEIKPLLSVLVSSEKDLKCCSSVNGNVYFQLPNGLQHNCDELMQFFQQNPKLVPWFPSVLIDEDYDAAVKFLRELKPELIVTNNTGIAYEAFKNEIKWIAGPFLNTTNSYALLNLKENFNCSGAFLSNELSKVQIQSIKKPEEFDLYYSIYHPNILMTSRQCLFHQVSGCSKNIADKACLSNCEKADSITNLKGTTFFIEKAKDNYHAVYNESNFLNTEIVPDFPTLFSGFLADLRDIKTETLMGADKVDLIKLFENMINGGSNAQEILQKAIQPTTNIQYKKGI